MWGAIASGVGSLLGFGSQIATNAQNYRIAQMNNQFNEKMMDKQMAYQTDMWNKQNEYNTPAAQAQRLREAGLNPSLIMGGANTGTAQSAGGITPATAQGVIMQAPQFNGLFSQAIQNYLQLEEQKRNNLTNRANVAADTSIKLAEAKYTQANAMAKFLETMSKVRGNRAQAYAQEITNASLKDMIGIDYTIKQNQLLDMRQNLALKKKQEILLDGEIRWFDTNQRAALANQSADTLVKLSQKEYTENQARHELYKILDTFETTQGKKLDNKVKERTVNALVQKAYLDASPEPNALNLWGLPKAAYQAVSYGASKLYDYLNK